MSWSSYYLFCMWPIINTKGLVERVVGARNMKTIWKYIEEKISIPELPMSVWKYSYINVVSFDYDPSN